MLCIVHERHEKYEKVFKTLSFFTLERSPFIHFGLESTGRHGSGIQRHEGNLMAIKSLIYAKCQSTVLYPRNLYPGNPCRDDVHLKYLCITMCAERGNGAQIFRAFRGHINLFSPAFFQTDPAAIVSLGASFSSPLC